MSGHPPLKLSRLRDIGWALWDPIGLKPLDGSWEESRSADEYDTYLLGAAGMLRRGASDEETIAYLMRIESEHMGLSDTPTIRERAAATVAALKEYLATLPGGPLRVR